MTDWDRILNVGTLVVAVVYALIWWLVAKRKADVAVTCLFEGLAIGQLLLRAFGGFFPSDGPRTATSYESASLFFVAALAAIVSLVSGAYRRATVAGGP